MIPAHVLTASRRLVERFGSRRWFVMRDAREAADNWSAVGSAVDMTARDARDWCESKIIAQETYVPSHDAERARAVLRED